MNITGRLWDQLFELGTYFTAAWVIIVFTVAAWNEFTIPTMQIISVLLGTVLSLGVLSHHFTRTAVRLGNFFSAGSNNVYLRLGALPSATIYTLAVTNAFTYYVVPKVA